MPILSPLSLKLKVIFLSTSVLSAAVALKLSAPAIAGFAVTEVPSIYKGVVSWLKPPYLYLVINCIIIIIVASSKLQSKHDHVTLSPEAHLAPHPDQLVHPPVPVEVLPHVQPTPPPLELKAGDSDVDLNTVNPTEAAVDFECSNGNYNGLNHLDDKSMESDDKEFVCATDTTVPVSAPEEEINGLKDEFLISKSSWSPTAISRRDSSEFTFPSEKPPASSRFGHRRAIKASPEGGKAALGVSKSKRQDTLESTWKTITEGRAMPLARHLRKSDTWETHGGRHHNVAPENQKTMAKSETFSDGIGSRNTTNNPSRLGPSPGGGGGGKLKKDPSLSQDELNRRVEAFIKKFNEEMRLQRMESLNQYMEMINRGAH